MDGAAWAEEGLRAIAADEGVRKVRNCFKRAAKAYRDAGWVVEADKYDTWADNLREN